MGQSLLGKNSDAYKAIQAGANQQQVSSLLSTQGFGLEVLDWEQYDDVAFAANTAVVTTKMFQTPIGQAGKSETDTSLTQAGQLEGGQAFRIRAYAVTILPSVAPVDALAFAQNCWFNLVISSGRSYLQRPALFIPGASVPIINAAAMYDQGAATMVQTVSNGLPSIGNVIPLAYPVTIGDGENFYVNFNVATAWSTAANNATPVAGTGIKFWFRMFGDLFRFIR